MHEVEPVNPFAPAWDDLNRIVQEADAALAYAWGQGGLSHALMILIDRRREDAHNLAVECWGSKPVDLKKLSSGDYIVGIQTRQFIDHLERQGKRPMRAAAGELRRGLCGLPLFVPVWVVHEDGHWVTHWTGQHNAAVVRYNPRCPEAN